MDSAIINITKDVLNIIPVPGLNLAFSIFMSVWESVEQAQARQEQLRVFVACIATLLKTLNRQYHDGRLTEESTFDDLQDLNRLLGEIVTFVQQQSSFSFLKLLFMKNESLVKIEGYYQSRIAATIQAFEISALVNICHWQRENEIARKADQKSLSLYSQEIATNQLLLAEALNIERHYQIQTCIDEKKWGQEELTLFTQSFQYPLTNSHRQVDVKPWTISPCNVYFGDIIGGGRFGVVYCGNWNRKEVALRVLRKVASVTQHPSAVVQEVEVRNIATDIAFFNSLSLWLQTWSKLQHPHILEFLGANISDHKPFITMPLIVNGNVHDYINNNPYCDRLSLIEQVASGLAYLHAHNIIHGDLKGSNILVDDSEKALLCDFGLSQIKFDFISRFEGSPPGFIGSPNWMAPELFNGGNLGYPCDVYSFAMAIYEIFTNEVPLGHLAPHLLREFVVDRNLRPGRPDIIDVPQLSDETWAIIQLCWAAEPTSRPTADVVCDMLNNKLLIDQPVHANPPLESSLPIQRMPAESLSESPDDFEPISRPRRASSVLSIPSLLCRDTVATKTIRRPRCGKGLMTAYRKSLPLENPGSVISVAQSSDGKVIVAGLSEGSCIMWHVSVGNQVLQDIEQPDPVTAIKFELSTSTYAAGFNSGQVLYHHKSLSDSSSTLMLTGNDKPILCLHVLNIVVMALTIGPGSHGPAIIKWCLSLRDSTSTIVERFPLSGIAPSLCLCAAFSPKGKDIYIGTSCGSLFIYSTQNGQSIRGPFHLSSPSQGGTLGHRGAVFPGRESATVTACRSLAVSPDSKNIMVSYSSGEIRLWDIKAGTYSVLRETGANLYPGSDIRSSPEYASLPVNFSPDGSCVAYASAIDPQVVNIQDLTSERVSSINLDDSPTDGIQSLDISPNNKRLIVTFHNSGRVMVYTWD